MYGMFAHDWSLVTLDLSTFDTSNVTDMYRMFIDDPNLVTIYVSDKWVTTAVTTDTEMFKDCSSLVGGNNTHYSSSNVGKAYAHIDVSGNPGYFTDIADKA